jgi:hypothetical protein
VVPVAARPPTNSQRISRWRGSSDEDGSSSSSTAGSPSRPDRDVHALLVAAREAPDLVARSVPEAGLAEHPRHDRVDVADALEPREQPQVLAHGELGVDRGMLRNPSDAPAGVHQPARGRQGAGQQLQSVVLPAPLGPTIARTSPGSAVKETPSSARRSP